MIYFVQNEITGHIKIGWSRNPTQRLSVLKSQTKAPIRMLGVIPGNRDREQIIHRQFEADSLGHEWFDPTERLVAAIIDLVTNNPCPEVVDVEDMNQPHTEKWKRTKAHAMERVRTLLDGRPLPWLAEKSGIAVYKIRDWLNNRATDLYASEAIAIARVFGVTVADLYGMDVDQGEAS